MLDLKIVNGTVVDGTGAPGYRGDIGVRDGRIVALGKIDEDARETIDASGKTVAPGFVDIHTHYDAQGFWDSTLSPSCYHGVTTIVGGNCGFSIAPLTPEAGDYLMPMLARVEGMPLDVLKAGVPWNWRSFGDFLGKLENKLAINAGFMAGHSAIRRVVMGKRGTGEKATPEDIERMKSMLDQALSEGALGFSTSVASNHNDAEGNPVPSRWASREEILELASVVSRHEGTSLELLPDLTFEDATIDLMTEFSIRGQRAVNWNVLVVRNADESSVEQLNRQLSVSDRARARGGEVLALTLPSPPNIRVNLMSGVLLDNLPGWAPIFRLSPDQRIKVLKDPVTRAILDEAARSDKSYRARFAKWGAFRIAEVQSPSNKPFEGLTVAEAAGRLGRSDFDTFLDIAIEDGLKTSFVPEEIGETPEAYQLRGKLWKDDRTIVGASDAGAHMDMIDTFAFSTKLLAKSREHSLLTTEEAVHQLTQVPASVLGLRERGLLREGWHADIAVFDADTVATGPVYTRFDLPGTKTEGRLYADAIGVTHVIVNGRVIVRGGEITDARPGAILHSGRDTYTVKLGAREAAPAV
jgi:N-acyl-D-aspartate/D-glutamate deacylase